MSPDHESDGDGVTDHGDGTTRRATGGADGAAGAGAGGWVPWGDGPDRPSGDSWSGALLVDRLGTVGPTGRRVALLGLTVGLFVVAFAVGRATVLLVDATVGVGDPGTVSRLVTGVAGLQVLGFGAAVGLVILDRSDPLAYLRVGGLDGWTAFYGAALGLAMMLVTVLTTLLFQLLPADLPDQVVVQRDLPFFLVLFALSTLVVVPMEELFFRGVVQRSLAAAWHPAVAIGVASLLFVVVHTTVLVATASEAVLFGLFFAFGVVLGVGYHVTGNLLVPIIGHALFNGAQILTEAVDVLL